MDREIVATCFPGFEDVLENEIVALGGKNLSKRKSAISFMGDKEIIYRANLSLRTALRVIIPILRFSAKRDKELYDKLFYFKWEKYFTKDRSIFIDVTGTTTNFNHTNYIAMRAKDAIVDYYRKKFGERPSVEKDNPDIKITLHFKNDICTVYLNTSGDSLHKRGYRSLRGEAPINETVAAALVLMSGFDGESDFIDLMCGSGTIVTEAWLIANSIAPNLLRDDFSFKNFKDFDENLFESIKKDLKSKEREFNHKMIAIDNDPKMIEIAQKNSQKVANSDSIKFIIGEFDSYKPDNEKGFAVINPPYGERLKPEGLIDLYKRIDFHMKRGLKGYSIGVITSNEELSKEIRMKPFVKKTLFNGGIECSYKVYKIY
ncbi:class I SAM-dependent RNA methyltransferase [bacterium]|nr:class I SAM-dependent RNA methyltransferase [bacterium]